MPRHDRRRDDHVITNAFVEGYLDTGDPQVNFTGCLSSFNVHTRSSPSFTATLKDFALGNFDTCNSKAGQKFQDTNANGVKDTGEPDLPTWQIKLFAEGRRRHLEVTEVLDRPDLDQDDRRQRQRQLHRPQRGRLHRLRSRPGYVASVAAERQHDKQGGLLDQLQRWGRSAGRFT